MASNNNHVTKCHLRTHHSVIKPPGHDILAPYKCSRHSSYICSYITRKYLRTYVAHVFRTANSSFLRINLLASKLEKVRHSKTAKYNSDSSYLLLCTFASFQDTKAVKYNTDYKVYKQHVAKTSQDATLPIITCVVRFHSSFLRQDGRTCCYLYHNTYHILMEMSRVRHAYKIAKLRVIKLVPSSSLHRKV